MAEKTKQEVLLLVDGNALVHRGFHAIPHLSNKKGEPTNGVYGFALLLLRALKEVKPQYVAVAFDLPEPTFRDKLYAEYKAKRVKAPDELYAQIPRVKELVRAFDLPVYEEKGYEADDIIGSLSAIGKKHDLKVVILTGDLDTLQLVDDSVSVFAPKQGLAETKIYDAAAIKERYGLLPEQLIDYKALRGDPSDNIPGVRGIGEKTASELLQKFGTLEKVYDYAKGKDTKRISERVRTLLLEHEKDAELSKHLVRIVRTMKLSFDLKNLRLDGYDESKVYELFRELEFKSLLDKLPKTQNAAQLLEKRESNDNYQLLDSAPEYEKFLDELQEQKEYALDTETTSLNPVAAQIVGIGFSWKNGKAYYVPAAMVDERLKKILLSDHSTKVGHNLKYDYLVLKRNQISLGGAWGDTMIAAYLLSPGSRNFDLDSLSFAEFGFRKTPITKLIGEGKNQKSMADVPVADVADYCGEDADYTWRLYKKLLPRLEEMRLLEIFRDIEMPLARVLAEMEYRGIKVDASHLNGLSKKAEKEIEKLEQHIWKFAGAEFNIGSPLQLKEVLFEKLKIPTENLKKGKTGLSTAATELEKLRDLHPIVPLIFEWRELTKLKNTYLDTLPLLINPETGRVHTSYSQTIAATGRLSSSDPNLQNIPVRTEFGRGIRKAFIAEEGFVFLAIDYSQIELRLAAHLSKDRKMMEAFKNGEDIHTATAMEIFGIKDPKKVTDLQRRSAKTINFGVLYGLSAYGLTSRIPGVSQGEAQDFIDKYFSTYSGLTRYLEEVVADVRRRGYVKNELGRVRYFPEISSSQFQVRASAERAAINMPFQSLSADIIKMAMNKLSELGLTNDEDCRLLLQVHDELLFEVKKDKVEKYAGEIAKIMTSVYKVSVPIEVEAKSGQNWEEMSKINI